MKSDGSGCILAALVLRLSSTRLSLKVSDLILVVRCLSLAALAFKASTP